METDNNSTSIVADAATVTSATQRTERDGLTTEAAEKLYEAVGFNELPHVEVSLWWILFVQFTGLMPYMMELACVLALAVQDYIDFAIIAAIVLCNGFLGFHEELKAKASLDELTSKMEQKIGVLRDGKPEHMLTRLLVPGDVILMVGGCAVPADVEWLEGDVLSIDTAAITGEPLPRNYPSEEYGSLILCGSTVKAGEAYCIVRKTGIHTEVGGSQAEIMQDKTQAKVSLFEERILHAVKIICLLSLVDVLIILLVQGIARRQFFNPDTVKEDILTCLSIIIAAVPVALPLVLQVTMALGAGKMARDFHAVVTSLPALQDISSMTVLCSDKTGTLTTAHITIIAEALWINDGFTRDQLALFGALASNRDKKEDPIDRSVISFFDKHSPPELVAAVGLYTKTRSVGFNPIYKRVLWEYSHPELGTITVAKGLPIKVIDTADGGVDDAADQWKVDGFERLIATVVKVDRDFSKAGYKTLGVSVKINDGPFKFVGIMPMLDPPRHDTKQTIANLLRAGIRVKMITGDHLNIAKETARLIGMGTNIQKGEETRVATQVRDELIWDADGFAQVLPRDKREVVLVLKNTFKQVVGMTGDGVNDAPALSAAQCGVAVDDATDAAKNAAAIILTSPGLSAIYSAVVESRRIFRKLKSYVIYRFAATIQIVVVLTILIFVANCSIDSLFIILLALFNDLSMLPVAYDRQQASAGPEHPDVAKILLLSTTLGLLQTAFSLLWAFVSYQTGIFKSNLDIFECSTAAQSGVWVQIFIAAELLIFSARTPSFIHRCIAPSPALTVSVFLFCLLVSVIACASSYFGNLYVQDVVLIWVYDLVCLVVLDGIKVVYFHLADEDTRVLADDMAQSDTDTDTEAAAHTAAQPSMPQTYAPVKDVEAPGLPVLAASVRADSVLTRMTIDAGSRSNSSAHIRLDEVVLTSAAAEANVIAARKGSSANIITLRKGSSTALITARLQSAAKLSPEEVGVGLAAAVQQQQQQQQQTGTIIVSSSYSTSGSSTDLRRKISGASLRPHVPANRKLH